MYRIGGRLWSKDASLCGVTFGIPLFFYLESNLLPWSGKRTVSGGQFDWGGRLLNSNGGVQRLAEHGQKSCIQVQRQKLDWLQDWQVEQMRKQDLVTRWLWVEMPELNG